MKRLFLDTNFIIDFLLRDEFKEVSMRFLEEGAKHDCRFLISYLSVANFAYVARRLSQNELYHNLGMINELFDIVPNTQVQIEKAIAMKAKDFEDALQYQAALASDCDCIITRNGKDFMFSEIPVISAAEYLQRL